MTTLNFPANPEVGQIFTTANKTYSWNGYGWAISPNATQTIPALSVSTLTVTSTSTINGAVVLTTSTIFGNIIPLGTPADSSLLNNNPAIVSWTTGTMVTDAIDNLNELLGKLIPPAPPVFPGTSTLSLLTLPSVAMRMTNFVQTNNTISSSKQLAAGTSLTNYKRSAAYATSNIINVGPGNTGTVSVVVNGTSTGSRDIAAGTVNTGTYNSLVISNNVDYGTVSNKTTGFWTSFNASAAGTATLGWNEIYITDTAGTATNTVAWYYDASTPGTPQITQTSFGPTTVATAYSSNVPHYTSAAQWTAVVAANRLSGDMYPTSDTFFTTTAGGVFTAPATLTYTAAGITTPLARNLYVASGSATLTSTVGINNATALGTTGPAVSVDNGYAVGSLTLTPGYNVLTINTSDTSKPNENNIVVGTFGSGGTSSAVRVGGLSAAATPATGTITAWNSTNTLAVSDATIVAGIIKNDKTNYSTGYLPAGPNLTAQSSVQYITFRIARAATSKFNIAVTGKISGCYVAMPGSSIDTTALSSNGWITPTAAYAGAGVPGTGTGGNGSNGCAVGGVMTTGSSATQSITVTFGTESSSNSTSNYIYVRFVLNTGDTITALSFPNPTN